MALVPMEPFRHLSDMGREFDRFFPHFSSAFNENLGSIRVDVHENGNEVVASCDIPGLEKKEDIHIDVGGNTLRLSGTINKTNEVKEQDMYRKERYQGSFSRVIPLPATVSDENVKATYKNGVLEIRMQKTQDSSKKKIEVDFQ